MRASRGLHRLDPHMPLVRITVAIMGPGTRILIPITGTRIMDRQCTSVLADASATAGNDLLQVSIGPRGSHPRGLLF